MIDHNPVDVLNNGKSKLIEEKTAIEEELNKFKKLLVDLDDGIAEYDYLIDCAKKMHMPKISEEPIKTVADIIEPEITEQFQFNDDKLKPIHATKCTQEINDIRYGKIERANDTQFTIRMLNNESTLNTTWEYLNDFYNSLPERTMLKNITDINRSKIAILAEFYVSHANFNCHIEQIADGINNGAKVLIKDEVTAGIDTAPMERNIEIAIP